MQQPNGISAKNLKERPKYIFIFHLIYLFAVLLLLFVISLKTANSANL